MYTFEKRVFINLPQREVFEYVTNPANNTHWQRTTVSADWATDEPHGVGSRIKSVIKFMGRPIAGEAVVTDWNPFSMYGFKGGGGGIDVAGKINFEPNGTGTQVTLNGQVAGTGIFKLLERIVGRQAEKQDDRNYEALKLLVEASSESQAIKPSSIALPE